MLFFALSGFLIGLLLSGLTVAALIPATIFILLIASGTFAIIGGEAFGPRMLEAGLLVVGLQLGYLAGNGVRVSPLGSLLGRAIRPAKFFWSTRTGSDSADLNSPLRD